VLTVISQQGHPVLLAVIALIAAAMAVVAFLLLRKREKRTHS
jgi:hypothetical protein